MFNLFKCVVEDNQDPLQLGRVKIRVLGIHSAKLKDVATEDLPWSDVLNPVTSAAGIGTAVDVVQGVWGYCIPINDAYTGFLFIGTIAGSVETAVTIDDDGDAIGFQDKDKTYTEIANGKKTGQLAKENLRYGTGEDYVEIDGSPAEFKEPKGTLKAAKYPSNNVYQDSLGNSIQVDGTEGNPRIEITHSTGSRITINTEGDIILESTGPQGVIIGGNLNVKGEITAVTDTGFVTLTQHIHTGNMGSPTTAPTPGI